MTQLQFSINYSEAGDIFKGAGLTLKELNGRLARIMGIRARDSDQSPWYYKTSVTMRGPEFEYEARIDICPRFIELAWMHRPFEYHLENGLKRSYKARHSEGLYGKMARDHARAACKALKLIKGITRKENTPCHTR